MDYEEKVNNIIEEVILTMMNGIVPETDTEANVYAFYKSIGAEIIRGMMMEGKISLIDSAVISDKVGQELSKLVKDKNAIIESSI